MYAHRLRKPGGDTHSNSQPPKHDALLLQLHELQGIVVTVALVQLVTLAGEPILLLLVEGGLSPQK